MVGKMVYDGSIGWRNWHGERPGLGFSSESEERWIHAVKEDWKPVVENTFCQVRFSVVR